MVLVKLNLLNEVNMSESIYSEYSYPVEGSVVLNMGNIVTII